MYKKIIWSILILAILTGVALIIPKKQPVVDVDTITSITNLTKDDFDPAKLKVGDVFAGMTVTSIGPVKADIPMNFKTMKISSDPITNYKITFKGKKVIEGTYSRSEIFDGLIFSPNPSDDPFLSLMNTGQTEWYPIYLNADSRFSNVGEFGYMTVEISEFEIVAYPADFGGYYATVKNIVKVTPRYGN